MAPTANARPATGAPGAPALPPDDPSVWSLQFRDGTGRIPAQKMTVAVQQALRESDPVKAMMYFSELIKELRPENAPAAFKSVRETVSGFETMRYMPMLTYAWGTMDGANALKAMKEIGGREAMLGSAATLAGFASVDPGGAKKWLSENGSAETKWILDRALVSGLARSDLEGATKYVLSMDEKDRGSYVEVLAEQKIKSGINEAATWAQGLSDPGMKASALQRVAQQYTRQDPAQAAEWAKQFASESYGKEVVGSVAREYADSDPKAALAWAATLPGSETQSEAYGRVFREWGRTDPTAASESLNSLPPGAPKDQAIGSFSRTIARESPEDAITWAGSIADPVSREETQVEVVQRWRMTNAEQATQWATQNLSPEAQQKVLQPPRFDGPGGGFFRPGAGGGGLPPGLFR
jgi:hypothetical protein